MHSNPNCHSPNKFERLSWVFVALCVCFIIITSLLALTAFLSPLPFYDTTSIVHFLGTKPSFQECYRYLLEEHNEHRIVFTKLLILLDLCVAGGKKLLPSIAIFMANAAIFAVILKNYWTSIERKYRPFWILTLVALFFSLLQTRNFDSVFQLQFFLVSLFAMFSFSSLAERKDTASHKANPPPWTQLMVSMGWAFLAAFNMANGLFAGMIIVAFALILFNWRYTLIATIVSLFSWWLYFRGYSAPLGADESAIKLHQLPQILPFLIYFFGNIFNGAVPYHTEVRFFGTIGLLGTGYFAFHAFRNFKRLTKMDLLTGMALLFVVMGIGAASLHRLGRGGMELALVGRYSSFCILFWAILISWMFSRFSSRHWLQVICALLLPLAILSITARQLTLLKFMQQQGKLRSIAALSLKADYIDPELEIVRAAWPAYDSETLEILRERHLSVFSTHAFKQLGETFRTPPPEATEGSPPPILEVSTSKLSRHAFNGQFQLMLEGALTAEQQQLLPRHFPLINEQGILVGYGAVETQTKGEAQKSVSAAHWKAFISGADGFWSNGIFAQTRNDAGYLKLNLETIGGIDLRHVYDLGKFTPVPFEIINIHRKWMKNGYFGALHPIHPTEDIWGTWSPELGDANSGGFTFKVKKIDVLRPHQHLVLPILVGPVRGACELSLLKSEETNAPSKQFNLGEMITDGWSYLDISELARGGDVIFKIEDKGVQWGQRVAFSMPVILNVD